MMKAPSKPMRSAATVPTSSGVPARPAAAPRGPLSSSFASGVMMMPGLIVLIRADQKAR